MRKYLENINLYANVKTYCLFLFNMMFHLISNLGSMKAHLIAYHLNFVNFFPYIFNAISFPLLSYPTMIKTELSLNPSHL